MNLFKSELLAFFASSLLGVLFHFVYEWSGEAWLAGLFFPINESTWEHLKLIFFPIMLTAALEYRFLQPKPDCFFCVKLVSAWIGMLATVVLFYTYSGILGFLIDWANIAIYFIASAISFLHSYRQLSSRKTVRCSETACIIGIGFTTLLFMVFSVFPPGLGLFWQP